MYFRRVSKLRDVVLVSDDPMTIKTVSPPGEVRFRRFTDAERKAHEEATGSGWFLAIEATFAFELGAPEEVAAVFELLSQERLPDGVPQDATWVTDDGGSMIHWEGFSIAGSVPTLVALPPQFQEWVSGADQSSEDEIRRVVDLIRWRCGLTTGSHNPVVRDRFEWSLDRDHWVTVPRNVEIYEGEPITADVTNEVLADVQTMVSDQTRAPFAHELLREAWEQRLFNPRSAILLAVAAAEVGLKQAISTLVPGAAYLVETTVIPPLPALMKNYVPQLPAKHSIEGRSPEVPEWIRKSIDGGIQTRNKLAHRPLGGREVRDELSYPAVTELLWAAQDLLTVLDFHTGRNWALALLSPRTTSELFSKSTGRNRGRSTREARESASEQRTKRVPRE